MPECSENLVEACEDIALGSGTRIKDCVDGRLADDFGPCVYTCVANASLNAEGFLGLREVIFDLYEGVEKTIKDIKLE